VTRRSIVPIILATLFKARKVSADSLVTTNAFVNGRFWQGLTKIERGAWVSGAIDSAAEFSKYVDAAHDTYGIDVAPIMKTTEERFSPKSPTHSEIAEKISLIYRDPKNLILPVIEVFCICSVKFNGGFATDRDFQDELSSTRVAYQAAAFRGAEKR
jgi:hypothetical protein